MKIEEEDQQTKNHSNLPLKKRIKAPKIRNFSLNLWSILTLLLLFITAVNGLNVNNHSNYVNRKKVASDSVENEELVKDLSNKL